MCKMDILKHYGFVVGVELTMSRQMISDTVVVVGEGGESSRASGSQDLIRSGPQANSRTRSAAITDV